MSPIEHLLQPTADGASDDGALLRKKPRVSGSGIGSKLEVFTAHS
jgi:hypothetical protein